MKKEQNSRKLISLVLTVVLLVTSACAVFINANSADSAPKNLFEQIIKEDGYLYGIFYFDLTGWHGHTISENDILANKEGMDTNAFDSYNAQEKIREDMYNIKQLGFNCVEIYALGHLSEGIEYDENNNYEILGLKDSYVRNFRKYLQAIKDAGMNVGINLDLHQTTLFHYYSKKSWDNGTRHIYDPVVREQYKELCLKPVLNIIKDFDNVAFISLTDEGMNQINDDDADMNVSDTDRSMYGTTMETMLDFWTMENELTKEIVPDVARGIATNWFTMSQLDSLDLDFVGYNNYKPEGSSNSFGEQIQRFDTQVPMIASEYGRAEYLSDEEEYAKNNIEILNSLKSEGYKGSFWWYYNHGNTDGLQSLFKQSPKNGPEVSRYCYRDLAIDFMDANYAGRGLSRDGATMLYNEGNGNVVWINGKNASKITLQKSTDGGNTWSDIFTNASVSTYKYSENDNMGYYKDTATQGACYRVITNGNITSEANNVWEAYE